MSRIARYRSLVGVFVILGCSGKDASGPAAPVVASVQVVLPNADIRIGVTVQASVTIRDAYQSPVLGRTVAWTSTNPAVASVSSAGVVTGIGTGTASIRATCDGVIGDAGVNVSPVPVLTTISVNVSPAAIQVGQTASASATGQDQNGASIDVGTVTWSTGLPSVASVSSTGVVIGIAPGQSSVIASAGGKQGQQTITVTAVPVGSITVAPPSVALTVGAAQQFSATTFDGSGNVLTGRAIVWTTSDATKATVNASGLATAIAAGAATITATSEGKSANASVAVTQPSSSISISSITPAILTPGVTATIVGSGFSSTAAQNTITIDGIGTSVTTASATQLVVTVPSSFPCVPTHLSLVKVTANGGTASATQTLRAGTLRSLNAGASLVITNPTELSCTELPAGSAHYVLSVYSNSQAPTSVTPFRLRGSATVPSSSVLASRLRALPGMMPVNLPKPSPRIDRGFDAVAGPDYRAMHFRILEANRAMYSRVKSAFNAHRIRLAENHGMSESANAAAVVPALGSTRKFRIAQFSGATGAASSCNSYKEVTARLAYAGSRALVYEDVAAPLATTMDSYLAKVGQEFDAVQYAIDANNFGDPLATDPFTDQDGHINMVFSPVVKNNGVEGFVWSCDFFQRDSVQNQSSNFGENFYALTPTVAGTGYAADTPDAWLRAIRGTVVHEVKHISSLGAHLVNNASSFEESWLEEGTARHAEEIWARSALYNVPWKGDATYAQSVFCDVRPSFQQCLAAPLGVYTHFVTLYDVLRAPGNSSLFGRTVDGDFNFYAVAWSFVRWTIDRYASSESAFLRALTQSKTLTGTANISAATGHSTDEMLGDWTLAFDLDENAAFAGNRDVDFPTWNLRSMYAGLATDFPSNFITFPLAPQSQPLSDFAIDNGGIHGGSFAMFDLTGSTPNGEAIGIAGFGGVGAASSSLRIAIARIQ